jgi:hypothetical protein
MSGSLVKLRGAMSHSIANTTGLDLSPILDTVDKIDGVVKLDRGTLWVDNTKHACGPRSGDTRSTAGRIGGWRHVRKMQTARNVSVDAGQVCCLAPGQMCGAGRRRDDDSHPVAIRGIGRTLDTVSGREKSVESLDQRRVPAKEGGDAVNDARGVDAEERGARVSSQPACKTRKWRTSVF